MLIHSLFFILSIDIKTLLVYNFIYIMECKNELL